MATAARRLEVQGKQAVTVNGIYAYVWGGEKPLAVGDRVTLPGTAWSTPWTGVVTALGSTYEGYHSHITARVE